MKDLQKHGISEKNNLFQSVTGLGSTCCKGIGYQTLTRHQCFVDFIRIFSGTLEEGKTSKGKRLKVQQEQHLKE